MIRHSVSRIWSKPFSHAGLRLFFLLSAFILIAAAGSSGVEAMSLPESSKQQVQQSTQEVTPLELGKPIERELEGGQKHGYQITLAEGQCASVIVKQRGIDLVVQLLGEDGKSIADFDNEIGNQGEEKIEVVAEAICSYRLLVRARRQILPAGRYEIRLVAVRNATEQDRLLHESRRLQTESRQLFAAGKYAEALPPAEKAVELRERAWGAKHPDLAGSLYNLADINYVKGDYAKAESLYARALVIAEETLGAEHPQVARLLTKIANVCSAKGDYSRAEPLYQRALAIQEKILGPDHPDVAYSLNHMAVLYRSKGDFARAEPLYERALTVSEKAFGEEHTEVARSLDGLASFYREKGDYAKAEPLYERALIIVEKARGTDHPSYAIVLNNLANLYRSTQDYAKAEPLYRRALAIKEKALGPNHVDVARYRDNLGSLYYAQGNYAKAEPLYLSALAIWEKELGPNHPMVGRCVRNLANLYFARNDYAEAEPLYHRALSIYEAAFGPDYYFLASILSSLARLYAAKGDIAQAIPYQARASAIIEHDISLNLAIGSERQRLAYLARLPDQMNRAISLHVRFAANDPAARELAATVILRRKGRVQDAMSNSFASLRSRSSLEDQALLDQLSTITSQLARLALNESQGELLAEHQKQIKTLEEQRERLESEVSRRSAGFYERSQPVTLGEVQRAIPADAALIELATYRPFDPKEPDSQKAYGERRYVAYVIRSQGEVRWKELGDAKTIDYAIDELRRSLRDPKRQVQQLARALDEKLMQPVRALVGDASHLLVSPDGALNLIPFEVLVDEQGKYLIERYSLSYLTSGRDLLRLQVGRESKSPPIVLANPLFGEPELIATTEGRAPKTQRASFQRKQERASKRQSVTTGNDMSSVYFAPLGGTAYEARAIELLFPEASVIRAAQATETRLKQVVAPRMLHIATHGFFLDDSPRPSADSSADGRRGIRASVKIENPLLRSGLALAGANLNNAGSDDGILTALEASGLNLWGTKLVTLSACDTGLGEVKNGEGVYGLRRAFVLAGTETLVMSLWPVSDYVTREMMTAYYRGLKQDQGRGESLRQVKLDLLKRKGREHPFYWAGFIQSGEWANLDGKR